MNNMSIDNAIIQLGVAGATLVLLYKILTELLPRWIAPLTEALRLNTMGVKELSETQKEVANRLIRLELKFDAAFNLETQETEGMKKKSRRPTPPFGQQKEKDENS